MIPLALVAPVSPGATSIPVSGPYGLAGNNLHGRHYAVVGAYTANAELMAIDPFASTATQLSVNVGGESVAHPHNAGDLVVPLVGGVIPVELYGILPYNSSTTFNTVQLQALINQLEARTGGPYVIQLSVGQYDFGTGIVIASPNVRIKGAGNAKASGSTASTELSFGVDNGSGGYAIDLRMAAGNYPGVVLEGFSLVGSSASRVLGGSPGGRADTGVHARTNITVKDVAISGFNVGVQADFIDHTYWESVLITSCKYGMYVTRNADNGDPITGNPGGNIKFEKCQISSNGIADIAFGAASGTLVSTVFADCHFGYSPCTFYIEPDQTFAYSTATTLLGTAPTFPTAVITVASTAGFPSRGTLVVAGVTGPVNYGGISGNTFINCTGGSGTPSDNAQVNLASTGQAGGLEGVVFDSTSFEQVGNRVMVTSPGASRLQTALINGGWGGVGPFGNFGGNAWAGLSDLGMDTTMIQANSLGFQGGIDLSFNFTADVFRIVDLYNSNAVIDLGNGLRTMYLNGSKLIRFVGKALSSAPNGLFRQVEFICRDRGNWMGRGYAVMSTGTVLIGDLLELASTGYAQQYQTSGAPPIGASMEPSNADAYPVEAMASQGAARINVNTANSISRNQYVKPDAANHGCVVAASGLTDGPIVGQAVDAATTAVSGFGSTKTVFVRLMV